MARVFRTLIYYDNIWLVKVFPWQWLLKRVEQLAELPSMCSRWTWGPVWLSSINKLKKWMFHWLLTSLLATLRFKTNTRMVIWTHMRRPSSKFATWCASIPRIIAVLTNVYGFGGISHYIGHKNEVSRFWYLNGRDDSRCRGIIEVPKA